MKLCFLVWALIVAPLFSVASLVKDNRIRYDNYIVYKVNFQNLEQRQILLRITEQHDNFSLWHETMNELHIMITPNALDEFQHEITQANLSAQLFLPNVQHLIDMEYKSRMSSRYDKNFNWKRYSNLEQIENWLDGILTTYPDVTEEFVIGQSYEGRNIRAIKISYKSGNPGVFIESHIHACEWITSATATWLINELLSSNDDAVRKLAENHDWYIVPVLNVDGFVYSHEKNRIWRKSRQPSNISSCIGVDMNRNYDAHWMENEGASDNPCSENYGGPHALSEPEIKAMSEFVGSIKEKLNVMLAFHSYSQLLLSPYGHTAELPPNYDDLMQVAKAYADAVNEMDYKTVYEYGSSSNSLYFVSGGMKDWAYIKQDIEISFTLEFRDTGRYGFLLPPAQIIPNAQEALIGITALLAECESLGYLKLKYEL